MDYKPIHIIKLFEPIRDRLKFLAVHGSCLYSKTANDIDIIAVLDSVDLSILNFIKNIHKDQLKYHIIPYSYDEISIFPRNNLMQFFVLVDILYGFIDVEQPTVSELINHLKIRLSDNIIMKWRNWKLDRARLRTGGLKNLLMLIQKDIYWWWRDYVYLQESSIFYDKIALSSKINHSGIKVILTTPIDTLMGNDNQLTIILEDCISVMVKTIKKEENKNNGQQIIPKFIAKH